MNLASVELPPFEDLQAQLLARAGKPQDLAGFARLHGYEPAAHHQILCDALTKAATEGDQRVMLFLPPGSAKSTYGSILFPAWYMGDRPGARVVAAAHTGTLAEYFGGQTRDVVQGTAFKASFGTQIKAGQTARADWGLDNKSTYISVGVGGGLTGRRADLLIIDDPVKDAEAAQSETQRNAVWEWYKTVAMTRVKPGGSQVLIMTRWHEEDLAGRILDNYPDWQVIKMRMEAVEGEDDPLGRKPGERLWPEYFTEAMVRDAKVDPRIWESLYQQNPTPMEGAFFKIGLIQFTRTVPKVQPYVAHDWAFSEGTGDYTAFVAMYRDKETGKITVDVRRFRKEPFSRNEALLRLAEACNPICYRVPEEMGGGGKEAAQLFVQSLVRRGINCGKTHKISGAKEVRAVGFAAAVNAGLVQVVESPTAHDFIEELRTFPNGKHDDMVDACSDAYNEMMLNETQGAISVHKRIR